MPNGKPAGVRCVQLDENNLCRLFGKPERPAVCEAFTADYDICKDTRDEALILLTSLEEATSNDSTQR